MLVLVYGFDISICLTLVEDVMSGADFGARICREGIVINDDLEMALRLREVAFNELEDKKSGF